MELHGWLSTVSTSRASIAVKAAFKHTGESASAVPCLPRQAHMAQRLVLGSPRMSSGDASLGGGPGGKAVSAAGAAPAWPVLPHVWQQRSRALVRRKLGHARPENVVEGTHPIDPSLSGRPQKNRARHSLPARVKRHFKMGSTRLESAAPSAGQGSAN